MSAVKTTFNAIKDVFRAMLKNDFTFSRWKFLPRIPPWILDKVLIDLWIKFLNLFSYHIFSQCNLSQPLKTSVNRKVFWCLQEVEKGCIGKNWLICINFEKFPYIAMLSFWCHLELFSNYLPCEPHK